MNAIEEIKSLPSRGFGKSFCFSTPKYDFSDHDFQDEEDVLREALHIILVATGHKITLAEVKTLLTEYSVFNIDSSVATVKIQAEELAKHGVLWTFEGKTPLEITLVKQR